MTFSVKPVCCDDASELCELLTALSFVLLRADAAVVAVVPESHCVIHPVVARDVVSMGIAELREADRCLLAWLAFQVIKVVVVDEASSSAFGFVELGLEVRNDPRIAGFEGGGTDLLLEVANGAINGCFCLVVSLLRRSVVGVLGRELDACDDFLQGAVRGDALTPFMFEGDPIGVGCCLPSLE